MSDLDKSLERACEEVDTWPDWKLDTHSLNQRNKRRAAGETLPKPTKEQARIAELEAQNQRLHDLVRYKRHELFNDDLISEDEYAELMRDHSAVDRLEGYDAAIAKYKVERDATTSELAATRAELARYNIEYADAIRAARRDKERLDWLENSRWSLDSMLTPTGVVWCCYLDHQGITDRHPEACSFTAPTAREAIDAARAAATEGTNKQ